MWYEPSNGIVTKPSNSSLTKLQYEKLVQETWSRYLRIPGKISASKADWPLLKTTEMVWRCDNSIFSAGICCIALPNSHPLIWRRSKLSLCEIKSAVDLRFYETKHTSLAKFFKSLASLVESYGCHVELTKSLKGHVNPKNVHFLFT